MNEEISRILELLEKGVISVDEAERLIKAAGAGRAQAFAEDASAKTAEAPPAIEDPSAEEEARRHSDRAVEDFWDPFSPFANPMPDVVDLTKLFRRVRQKIKRHNTRRFWWNYFRLNRWYEHRRAQRRETMNTYERVRFVLLGAPAWGDFILQAQTPIAELLDRDRIAWDLFRYGLEEEFGVEVTLEQAREFRTVQDVVDWVEGQQGSQKPSATETDASTEATTDPEGLAGSTAETPAAEPERNKRGRGNRNAGQTPVESSAATESPSGDDAVTPE